MGQSEAGRRKGKFRVELVGNIDVGIVVANMSGVNDNVGGGPDQVTRLT